MTIRAKVWLFAAVALGLVGTMGWELYQGASRGARFRTQVVAIYEQFGLYGQMYDSAWEYLVVLLDARQKGRDTREVFREHQRQIDRVDAHLRELLSHEWQESTPETTLEEARYIDGVLQARHRWAARAEQVLREAPLETLQGHGPQWTLFTEFKQEVAPYIEAAALAERAELKALQPQWIRNTLRGKTVGYVIPSVSLVLLGGVAALILRPLHRSLQQLLKGAEQLGRGDFEVELPFRQRDELGKLADAFHHMAEELRDTLKEKQRLREAETQVAEREFRRYSSLLEEKVRRRTAELEQANAQLADSLQKLQAAQEQLLFADRLASMGRVAAGVAHEINNPLAFVLSNLTFLHEELLRTEPALSGETRREMLSAVADAYEGADRVRLIVQDLKVLSRQDDAARTPVDVVEVVRGAAKMATHELRHRARLVEAYDDVPRVLGNAARLGQVFLNLLINAAHAIPKGKAAEHEIRLAARSDPPGYVSVEVSDTGCGIPEELLGRIFDPFFTTKPVGEGTGLGLSVSQSIITALGGRISVESQVGRGTTFRVSLPAAETLAESAAVSR